MITEIYYHGTKASYGQNIINSRKLIQVGKRYEQSEDGFVYVCHERDFAQTIAYALEPKKDSFTQDSFTFVKIEIVVDSELYKNLETEFKDSDLGKLISVKHKGELNFDDEGVQSAKIVTLRKGQQEYSDFIDAFTSCPPKYDLAKSIIDNLTWITI